MYRKLTLEAQGLNRITSAYVIIFLMITASILGIFTFSLAHEITNEIAIAGSRSSDDERHLETLKSAANENGSWGDAETTAVAVISLYSSGTEIEETWYNLDSDNVSIANEEVPNSMTYLSDYLRTAELNVEAFSLAFLAFEAMNATGDLVEPLKTMKARQNSTTGSWNNNVYDTALATYSISIVDNPADPSITAGIKYILGEEKDLAWDSDLDSALSILALDIVGTDVSGELKELALKQDLDGSFGSVKSTAWSIAALSSDQTGASLSYAETSQAWLKNQSAENISTLELAYAVMGESVDVTLRAGKSPDYADNGGSGDNAISNETIVDEILSPNESAEKDGANDGKVEDGPPFFSPDTGEDDRAPSLEDNHDKGETDKAPSELFSRTNLLWLIVAVVSIVFIVSLAVWGLIARVEEGKALDGVRRDIMEYIRHNPGEHFAGIMHEFDMSPSSTTYHLKVLEDTEQVVAHKDNKYKRFYEAGNTISIMAQTKDYKELISVLKNATSRKIVWYLLNNQGSSQKDVAGNLEIHPSTVNWHANRLKDIGILEKIKTGKEVSYTIINEESVRSVMAIIEERT